MVYLYYSGGWLIWFNRTSRRRSKMIGELLGCIDEWRPIRDGLRESVTFLFN